MGYTHYFSSQRNFTDAEWAALTSITRKIVLSVKNSIPLAFECDDENTPPLIDNEQIRFNGVGDDGHETFIVSKKHSSDFNFCKTAQKPYDEVVVAVLCAANSIAPSALDISSDGDAGCWKNGCALAAGFGIASIPKNVI